jgi:hypothetical protein
MEYPPLIAPDRVVQPALYWGRHLSGSQPIVIPQLLEALMFAGYHFCEPALIF